MFKHTIYANNPINNSKKLAQLLNEIDYIKFDNEGDRFAFLIQECLINGKSSNHEVNLLIGYSFTMGILKIQENKEAFSALSHIGMPLSLPLIVRHTFELWAAINCSEQCLKKILDRQLEEVAKASNSKKILKLVAGTKLPDNLLPKEKKFEKSIHILDLIRELKKEKWEKAEDRYDILSEFCHPNFMFNFIPIGMYSKFDFRTGELDPSYEKTLFFLLDLEKTALIGIKESMNNISQMCFNEYGIQWVEKVPEHEISSQEICDTQKKEGLFQKFFKAFH